jgi:hypothetical protein
MLHDRLLILQNKNMPALLDAILIAAEMSDLRADRYDRPDRNVCSELFLTDTSEGVAEASVIEARTEKGRGCVCESDVSLYDSWISYLSQPKFFVDPADMW